MPDAAATAGGWAAYLLPAVLVPVGLLMVTRSSLVAVGPFKLGLGLTIAGFLVALGSAHGGWAGRHLERVLAPAIGDTGATILGVMLALVGVLFLTGASLGALLRRSGHAVHRASKSVRRREPQPKPKPAPEPEPEPISFHPLPKHEAAGRRRARLPRPRLVAVLPVAPRPIPLPVLQLGSRPTTRRRGDRGHAGLALPRRARRQPKPEYRLPDRSLLHRSPPGAGPNADANARVGEALLVCLSNFGVEATIVGTITGPRVTRYEIQLAPGIKVGKVAQLRDDLCYALATTEIRILAPIPGKQAVGVEVPNLSPNLVTLGDIFGDIPPTGEPARRLARQGDRRRARLLRPRAHAAPADRGHHRLGQVGLHQHDPHLDPAPLEPGSGADDPDRPQADRAQPLRVDPAPADAGRLEPEGGERRPAQRRHGDGAPLRAPRAGARPRAAGGEPRASASAASRSCRTCSS